MIGWRLKRRAQRQAKQILRTKSIAPHMNRHKILFPDDKKKAAKYVNVKLGASLSNIKISSDKYFVSTQDNLFFIYYWSAVLKTVTDTKPGTSDKRKFLTGKTCHYLILLFGLHIICLLAVNQWKGLSKDYVTARGEGGKRICYISLRIFWGGTRVFYKIVT